MIATTHICIATQVLQLGYVLCEYKAIDKFKKGKVLPYLLPSIGPRAEPGVQAVSPHMTYKVIPGSRLPLLSTRPAVTILRPVRSYIAW